MRKYNSKAELVGEIVKRAELFIGEFSDISDGQKDIVIDGVDRTPAQMIAYQLGWMHLLIEWEEKEQRGEVVLTPSDEFKWNNLGGLYGKFYSQYEGYTIDQLRAAFRFTVERVSTLYIVCLTMIYSTPAADNGRLQHPATGPYGSGCT